MFVNIASVGRVPPLCRQTKRPMDRLARLVQRRFPSITWAQMESGAGPAEQGDPSAVLFGDIAEGLAHHAMLLEVMMLSNQFVPASLFLRANQLHTDFFGGDFPECSPNQM